MTMIRLATVDDSDAIAGFQIAMALETERQDPGSWLWFKRPWKLSLKTNRKGFYLVAQRGGEVCASLLITYEWSDWRNSVLVVHPVGLRVARAPRAGDFPGVVPHRLYELAQEQDVMFIRLYVEVDNHAAQKVYESLGMKRMPYYMYDVRVSHES